uniref:Uncharacterized protein n=1 Tax=Micrurus lemniscatus lemniscatus TaxID=129467 RepID=A0A2D4IWG1_MICLE
MKAVIRGTTISYNARRNRENYTQQNNLKLRIKELESQLQNTSKDRRLQYQMIVTKHKLNLLEQEGLITELMAARQIYFEQANKPGRWLSYKLKKLSINRWKGGSPTRNRTEKRNCM